MVLTEEVKNSIKTEYNSFKDLMYTGKSKEERAELDQFFTPPDLTISMIEKFDCDSLKGKTILDPCCGSGNLLIACLIAGADPCNIYGNDYDKGMVESCRKRLSDYISSHFNSSVEWNPIIQIHRGNALQKKCVTDFSEEYNRCYNEDLIDDLTYAQENYYYTPDIFSLF